MANNPHRRYLKRAVLACYFALLAFFTAYGLAVWLPGLSVAQNAAPAPEPGRGEYLAKMGDCTSCHTAPGHPAFAGGLAINSPMGVIYSTNITPDPEYGIGKYSLEAFGRALREGLAKDGSHLYPAMPYPSFAALSDEDIAALYDYFEHKVTPVHENPQQTHLSFPFNQRWGIWFWDEAFLKDRRFKPDSDHDEPWNRGAYLVQSIGHCGACHTPRGPAFEEKGSPDSRIFLTGEVLDNWYAPNLRGDKDTGLGNWSEGDIVSFLKTGHGADVAAFGNMAQVVENSTQYMHDDDLKAVAHYLKSIPPISTPSPYPKEPSSTKDVFERPGAGIYASYCSHCHQPEGYDPTHGSPKLAGNPAVLSKDPASLIRLLLEGGKTPETTGGPKPEAMPAFAKLTDREIADVLSYIRQNWNNEGTAVTPRDVAHVRKSLQGQ